jgi:hypothetical protein
VPSPLGGCCCSSSGGGSSSSSRSSSMDSAWTAGTPAAGSGHAAGDSGFMNAFGNSSTASPP